MAVRGFAKKLKVYEKILILMSNGHPITPKEIEERLGDQIKMYRLSNYFWSIKDKAHTDIKTIKDGKKVLSYQIMDIEQANYYLQKTNAYEKYNANI